MRIAMLGQKGLPAHSGGIERHVEELATRLVKAGNEVICYARKHYIQGESPQEYKGIKLAYTPSLNRKNTDAATATLFASIAVLFQNVDIIHYHGIGPALFAWIPRIFKPKTKVIVTFHCADYNHQKWGWFARTMLKAGEWMACKVPHKTIVVSKTLQKYVKNTYGVNAVYVPNGVSMPEKREADEIKKLGLEKNGYILSVSRLVKHKGIHHLIEAYKNLEKAGASVPKLVIVGSAAQTEGYEEYLHEMAKDNENIIFTGALSGSILEELYSNAKLFVQPSESEGLSIALLEAMSYGIPVLVSDIPENKEALPPVGLTFENKNVASLENKLKNILDQPSKAQVLARHNKEHVRKNYDFDALQLLVGATYTKA